MWRGDGLGGAKGLTIERMRSFMSSSRDLVLGTLFACVVETVSACAAYPQQDINPWEKTTRTFGNTRSDAAFFQTANAEINLPKIFIALLLAIAVILLTKKVTNKIEKSLISMGL